MKCTQCGKQTQVIDTQKFDTVVWRRRRCPGCNYRINTHETVVETTQNSRVIEQPKASKPVAVRRLNPSAQPATRSPPATVTPIRNARKAIEELQESRASWHDDEYY